MVVSAHTDADGRCIPSRDARTSTHAFAERPEAIWPRPASTERWRSVRCADSVECARDTQSSHTRNRAAVSVAHRCSLAHGLRRARQTEGASVRHATQAECEAKRLIRTRSSAAVQRGAVEQAGSVRLKERGLDADDCLEARDCAIVIYAVV